jgi:hypothetical protein
VLKWTIRVTKKKIIKNKEKSKIKLKKQINKNKRTVK